MLVLLCTKSESLLEFVHYTTHKTQLPMRTVRSVLSFSAASPSPSSTLFVFVTVVWLAIAVSTISFFSASAHMFSTTGTNHTPVTVFTVTVRVPLPLLPPGTLHDSFFVGVTPTSATFLFRLCFDALYNGRHCRVRLVAYFPIFIFQNKQIGIKNQLKNSFKNNILVAANFKICELKQEI